MSNAPRHYKSTPPPAPDEYYWAALLAQDDEGSEDRGFAEESDWIESDNLPQLPPKAATPYHGEMSDWDEAEDAYHNDLSLRLIVVGYNKGGLLVEWNSLRGFVPASQLVDNLDDSSVNFPSVLEQYIDQELQLRVIEINQEHNRLILSERAAQVLPGTRATTLNTLQPGTTCCGTVTNICDFGVFVDLGGVEGLVHISEISWGRVEHPSEVLRRSQQIDVYIMDVTPEKGRIALSIKRLQPDPWITVEERYQVGEFVEGVITTVVDFGAFAALEEGLEGLIHISELAEGHFLHPRNVVREGETVTVRILNIDNQARRIGLSLRNSVAEADQG
jgi:small subunit ribosomal protein S1